jgi:hypothetical protein
MRRVRRELADPLFSISSDPAILKILSAAEAAANASESVQIGTLVSDSVRAERLIEFLELPEHQRHFGKNRPISGVDWINVKNSQKSVAAQVADRVYRVRNRIVHAKDDPKYANMRVLLPKSREAYALGPDIELVRLVAIEVITDSQIG